MNEEKIDLFFKLLKEVLQLEEKTNLKNYSLPVLFEKQFDENFISDYLAILLNPKKINSSIYILKNILELNILGLKQQENLSTCKVIREFQLTSRSRIDIWIEVDNSPIIIIENKIYSSEGENQTTKYVEDVENNYPESNPFYIYLTPNDSDIKPISDKFYHLSYKRLFSVIGLIFLEKVIDNNEAYLIQSFLHYIEEVFMEKQIKDISISTKKYIENYDLIKKLNENFEEDSSLLFKNFLAIMENIFNKEIFEHDVKPERNYQQFYKKEWNKQANIHFEIAIDKNKYLLENSYFIMIHVERDTTKLLRDKIVKSISENTKAELINKGYKISQGAVCCIHKEIKYDKNLYEVNLEIIKNDLENVIKEIEPFFEAIDNL